MKKRLLRLAEGLKEIPFLSTLLSTGWNLTFALINGVISLVYSSYWYLTLFAFYLLLGLMKMSAVTLSRSKKRTEADLLRHNALAMFGLAVIVCGLMILTIKEVHNPVKNKTLMIITAAYTFVFVGLTVNNVIRAHMQKSAVMITLRNISCAGALVSLLSLERAMLGTFGNASNQFSLMMQAWSGGIVFVILIILGIGMLMISKKHKEISQ